MYTWERLSLILQQLCMMIDSNWTHCDDCFTMYKNTESQCHLPETNMVLYANHNNLNSYLKMKHINQPNSP